MSGEATESLVRQVDWVEKSAIVVIAGEINLSQTTRFQDELTSVLTEKPDRVILDLAGVSYMDSSGIASLVKMLSRVRATGATMHLVGASARIRSLFEITRLDNVFDIHDSREDVLNA
jgi:anti-sigma B factor antagonist